MLVVQQADNGNTERATIVSRLFQSAALTEDAIRIGEIKVDTARYTLAGDARAFGLRVVRQGSSRANPYSNETLTLYVPQGPKLAKVLDGLEMTLRARRVGHQLRRQLRDRARQPVDRAQHEQRLCRPAAAPDAHPRPAPAPQGDECVTQERPATVHVD